MPLQLPAVLNVWGLTVLCSGYPCHTVFLNEFTDRKVIKDTSDTVFYSMVQHQFGRMGL